MNKRILIAGVFALATSAVGLANAQSTTTAPATTPPERLTGSTTANNPATAATPTPPATTDTAPANAPVSGANSFTEGEARSRIESHGFTQVTDLKLDDKGVWRGSATKDGKSTPVALDYQGNVVGQ